MVETFSINLNSIILYELRNSIAKPGKAPLRRPIEIRQAKVTQPGEAIGLAFPTFHFETAIFFLKTSRNSPLFLRPFQLNLAISKRSEPKIIIEFRL